MQSIAVNAETIIGNQDGGRCKKWRIETISSKRDDGILSTIWVYYLRLFFYEFPEIKRVRACII